jgi:hypothetical protein
LAESSAVAQLSSSTKLFKIGSKGEKAYSPAPFPLAPCPFSSPSSPTS